MATPTEARTTSANDERHHVVGANGVDIHYVETGAGEPVVLLNNGMISSSRIWASWLSSYAAHRAVLAEHFRVIEPDFRGSGRTVHPGGPVPYDLLVDDAAALIDSLGLETPFACGYGDGGHVATILGLRHPDAVRAIVNHGGFDLFNPDPQARSLVMTRQMLGGHPDATEADPDVVEGHEHLRVMVDLMKADHDDAQGDGHWKTVLRQTFDRVSQPAGYTFEDFHTIAAPMLVLVGDRDPFCSVEEGSSAYRALPRGELAVLPSVANGVNRTAIDTMIAFLERH